MFTFSKTSASISTNSLIDPKEKNSEVHYKLDLSKCPSTLPNINLATDNNDIGLCESSWHCQDNDTCQSSPGIFYEDYINFLANDLFNNFFLRSLDTDNDNAEKSKRSCRQDRWLKHEVISYSHFFFENYVSHYLKLSCFMCEGYMYYVGKKSKVTYDYSAHKYFNSSEISIERACKSWEIRVGDRIYDMSKSIVPYAFGHVTGRLSTSRSPAYHGKRDCKKTADHAFYHDQFGTHEEKIKNENRIGSKSQILNEECDTTRIIVEDVDMKLESPNGTRKQRYQDINSQIWRLGTFQLFQGFPHLGFEQKEYASAGFYLISNNLARCSGCRADYPLLEIKTRPSDHAWHHQGCKFIISRNNGSSSLVNAIGNLSHSSLPQVCSDTPGRILDEVGGPPGQQSVYIPPGDIRSESYRLSTFKQFPATRLISCRSLAKSGFYYTGFHDQVKCFECGISVERWEEQDNPNGLQWHKNDCAFIIHGRECGNIPMLSMFSRITADLVSRRPEEILHQRDPVPRNVIRTVRYSSELPERIRRSGGIFEIGPGNELTIQSGPGPSGIGPPIRIGSQRNSNPSQQRPFRLANVVSPDHRRFISNLYLNRELDRLSSFGRWPVSRPTIPPAALARHGFFYLGDMDRTQCFSCSGVLRNWTIEDDAFDEHRVHFPNCKMVLGTEDRNVPIPEEDATPEIREQQFLCQYPSNPHMRNEAARLATFDQRWPRGTVGASPAVIAQAGFFFLGERDRVKCWYCNGGLQNWEYDDLPWIEHAKWFPNCQFVLQNQGVRFVYRNLSLYPHLNRPIIARQEGATIDPAGALTAVTSTGSVSSGQPPRAPSPPPVIIDPRIEMRKKQERIARIVATSQIVQNVIMMGFSEQTVKNVLEEKINAEQEANPNDIFDSTEALLDAVMAYDQANQEMEQDPDPRSFENFSLLSAHSQELSFGETVSVKTGGERSNRFQVSEFDSENEEDMMNSDIYGTSSNTEGATGMQIPRDSKELKETLDKMEEERLCKVCFSNAADMVFVPCGHMICCLECTQALRHCPVCRKRIEKAIKTYVS